MGAVGGWIQKDCAEMMQEFLENERLYNHIHRKTF